MSRISRKPLFSQVTSGRPNTLGRGVVEKGMHLRRVTTGFILAAAACFLLGSECRGKTGSVSVIVMNPGEAPIVGAEVKAAGRSGRTGSGGVLFLDKVPEGDYVVEVNAPGFAPGYHRVLVKRDTSASRIFRLLPVIHQNIRDLSSSISLEVGGVDLLIPGGAIGERGPGTLRLAYINPATGDVRSMPGEFDGKNQNGEQVSLETFGAFSLEIQDQSGKHVALRKPLIARMPYTGNGKPYEEVPLWSYDSKIGTWKQEGVGKILKSGKNLVMEAKIPHLSWWNLDQPVTSKTSIWVKSFVAPGGEALRVPTLSGAGLDYTGLSFPYEYYEKFFAEKAPVLPGACIDVKTGSKVRLRAGFYGNSGVYESERDVQLPPKNSSCRKNPQDGIIIEKMELGRKPASCLRGRLKLKGAPLGEMALEVFQPPGTKDTAGGPLWFWNRPIAVTVASSDGSFCIDHLPAGRQVNIVVWPKPAKASWFSVVSPLYAEDTACGAKRMDIVIPVSQGFRCDTQPEQCADIGNIEGDWRQQDGSCGGPRSSAVEPTGQPSTLSVSP